MPDSSRPRPIRPPDPAIPDAVPVVYAVIKGHEAIRRLVHLAFRDAHTALDLTFAHGGFWRGPLPPDLHLTTSNIDAASDAELHLDFTRTGLPDGAYDLVVYDPPHVADGGKNGIMARRFGTVRGIPALRELIEAGAREAWRIATVGILVKVTDHSHQGELLLQSDWVKGVVPVPPYIVQHTIRAGHLRDGKHRAVRVPRSNGAVWLAFRKDGHHHRSFDLMYERQTRKAG